MPLTTALLNPDVCNKMDDTKSLTGIDKDSNQLVLFLIHFNQYILTTII